MVISSLSGAKPRARKASLYRPAPAPSHGCSQKTCQARFHRLQRPSPSTAPIPARPCNSNTPSKMPSDIPASFQRARPPRSNIHRPNDAATAKAPLRLAAPTSRKKAGHKTANHSRAEARGDRERRRINHMRKIYWTHFKQIRRDVSD